MGTNDAVSGAAGTPGYFDGANAGTGNPGAAALTRLGGGTGFRGDEEVFSSRNAAPLNNGLGRLTQQYQAVAGAVDTGSTPSVQYTYSDPSTGSLLTSMVYPNGRTINYNYGDTGGVLMNDNNAMLDQAIGRLDGIVDASTGIVLEQYSYLGLSTIVGRNHPQTGINLSLVGSGGSIGSGGDEYVGLDQFGRVVNQNWVNSAGTTVDGYTYSYDANSNVTAKSNVLDSAYSETYTYDSLNRLTAATRGGASYQSWGLDAQGNWSSFTSNGSTQTRTANAQNQITSISGQSTPTYDGNGNMVSDQNGDTLVYDAWGRLVEVKNSAGAVIAQYTYDARGYRASESYPLGGNGIAAGTTNYPGAAAHTRLGGGTGFRGAEAVFSSRSAAPLNIYYDSNWQAIEVRTNGTAASNVTSQTVWSAAYINAPVLQDTYVAGVLVPNSRLYFVQDANWNSTAVAGLVGGSWQVVQRFVYSPYGNIIILNPNFTPAAAGTTPLVQNLYQGMLQDPVTGLYYERARWYSPSLGTWISQDPLQYTNGANTYQFVMGNPVGRVDPAGGAAVPTTVPALVASMIHGHGHLFTSLSRQGSAGSYFTASFVPSKKCDCKKIEFVQLYQEGYTWRGLYSHSSSGWELDDKPDPGQPALVPAPFYAYQYPGSGSLPAQMTDNPGLPHHGPFTLYSFFLQTFATFAVCVSGKDAGHAYAEQLWGQTFRLSLEVTHLLGGPASSVTRTLAGAVPPSITGPLWEAMSLSHNG